VVVPVHLDRAIPISVSLRVARGGRVAAVVRAVGATLSEGDAAQAQRGRSDGANYLLGLHGFSLHREIP
jgi:hypothetical protein